MNLSVSYRAACGLLLLAASRCATLRADDLLGDRELLERTVHTIVEPFLQQEPASATDATAARDRGPKEGQAIVRNGRAWAIVVGIVSKQGRHVFGHGRVAADSSVRPDGRTLFEIGSVTKTFTALLLADAVERGAVKLDDPVRLYLPDTVKVPKRGDKEITLLHLATHTSGLPRIPTSIGLLSLVNNNPYRDYRDDHLYKTLGRVDLARDPGADHAYSNLAYGLLGHALCRQADCGYEDLVNERVCKRLGLRDTRITLDDDQRRRLAAPYTASASPASNWDFDVLAGAGALRSTADDMLTYLEANMGLKESDLLPAMRRCHTIRHPTSNKIQFIGLGWHVEKRSNDSLLVFHGGGTGGYNCLVGFLEKDGEPIFGLVVLTNAAPAATGIVGNDVAVRLIDALRNESD